MTKPRKVALVTGGGSGIGRVIAADFARDHDVALTYHQTTPTDLPEGALAIQADLAQADAPARVIKEVVARFGKLDIIVNNAGQIAATPLDAFDPDAMGQIMDVNLRAPQALLAAALPHLDAGAAIVSLSSVNAVLPPKGAVMYGASKAALNLWTRAMAKELGPQGIRVNAVAPGAVNTAEKERDEELTQLFLDMTALGRLAVSQDIADAVRFLAGDMAKSITGEVLTVSGGYRL